jgi:hypothetical protein
MEKVVKMEELEVDEVALELRKSNRVGDYRYRGA